MPSGRRYLFSATLAAFAIGSLAMLPAAPLHAAQVVSEDEPLTLTRLVAEAELILRGEATDVRFRLSDGDADTYSRVPHTWVTYRIEETYRGAYDAPTVTLRFIGGATGVDGRVMRLSGTPLFKIGDTDILFVRGNGAAACPLVACGAGRYRIADAAVFTDRGRTLRLGEGGRIAPGSRVLDEEAVAMVVPPAPPAFVAEERARLAATTDPAERARADRYLAVIAAERVLSVRTVEPDDVHGDSGRSLPLAEFVAAIRAALPSTPPAEEAADAPFDAPVLVTRPKPLPFRVTRPPAPPPEITRERALYERAGRNPVLTPR